MGNSLVSSGNLRKRSRICRPGKKRELLMKHRKEQLRDLIQTYYRERGWTPSGIPTLATLKRIGLWDFLTEEARGKIALLAG